MADALDRDMSMPKISRYMTRQPWTINDSERTSAARQMMRHHAIHHLPVLEAGKLVGIVSERDLNAIESLPGAEPGGVTVAEAMTAEVYAISPDAFIADVVEAMATHRYGSAVVIERDAVVGIFTAVDALQVFAEMLRAQADVATNVPAVGARIEH